MSNYQMQPNHSIGQQNQRNKPAMMNTAILSNNTPTPNSIPVPPMMAVNNNFHPPTHTLVTGLQQKTIMTASNQMTATNQMTAISSNGQPANQNATNQIPPANQNASVAPSANGLTGSTTVGSPLAAASSEVTQQFQNGVQESNGQTTHTEESLANTKEKTPMCLINELARYNKISHQYTLMDEQGPAHQKTFYVQLKLGDKEEYSESGPSIKKAQHSAAALALRETGYAHPPPKPPKTNNRKEDILGDNTPTVELNALLMKRGEQALYKPLDSRASYYPPPNYNYRGMYQQRYHYARPRRVVYMSLKVGTREFIGEGSTRQEARHDAASKALHMLQKLPLPNEEKKTETPVKTEENQNDDIDNLKSEISLVHEIALKRNLNVSFDVTRESGPPHMKLFVTRCRVGEFEAEAEGQSKKMSKKRVAEMMLEKLKELPVLPPSMQKPRNKPNNKKKAKNIIKQMQKANPDYGVGINPISRLIQIQQAQQKKEPVYTLVTERGLPRRREFVIQVAVDDQTCTGVGPNKKLAKRHAAEAMLILLGYNKPSPQPVKPAIKSPSATPENAGSEKKVTFSENSEERDLPNGKVVRQMVPGLIRLPDANYTTGGALYSQNMTPMGDTLGFGASAQARLRDITHRNKVDLKFDEFAGTGNKSEVLSRLTLLTNPPRTFHGSGATTEAARDECSMEALKFLSEYGKEDVKMSGGDAGHMKMEPTEVANSVGISGPHTGRVATI